MANKHLTQHVPLISWSDACQAKSGKATISSVQAQLASAAKQVTQLQESVDSLEQESTAARTEASESKCQVEAGRQQAQQDMQVAHAAFKSELMQKERSWKEAMATAVADHAARDEALRKCLRAEVEAVAQQDKENLKRDSNAAMSQQAAEWQAQMSQMCAKHAAALAQQVAEIESKHAQQAQHDEAKAQQDLNVHASKLQQAHAAALEKQAEQSDAQLSDCKQRYPFKCLLITAQAGTDWQAAS